MTEDAFDFGACCSLLDRELALLATACIIGPDERGGAPEYPSRFVAVERSARLGEIAVFSSFESRGFARLQIVFQLYEGDPALMVWDHIPLVGDGRVVVEGFLDYFRQDHAGRWIKSVPCSLQSAGFPPPRRDRP